MKQLVLVGGGHAQLATLMELVKRPLESVEATLITPLARQVYSGMVPGWMAGHYRLPECQIDLASLARAANVRLIPERVTAMQADGRRVHCASGRVIPYDLLCLDVGSETNVSRLEPLGDHLVPLRPINTFVNAWPEALARARSKAPFTVAVVGAGAAGVEIALAASFALASMQLAASVHLVASEAGILETLAAGPRERARNACGRAGIQLHAHQGEALAAGIRLSNGEEFAADVVIAATGASAPQWLRSSGLQLDEQGYVLVDACHRSVSHADVFAVGDVCSRVDGALTRSGVHAVKAGPVVTHNLKATLGGRALQRYEPRRTTLYILACGPRYAIASWGRWSAEGRWVWRLKDAIDRAFIRRHRLPGKAIAP